LRRKSWLLLPLITISILPIGRPYPPNCERERVAPSCRPGKSIAPSITCPTRPTMPREGGVSDGDNPQVDLGVELSTVAESLQREGVDRQAGGGRSRRNAARDSRDDPRGPPAWPKFEPSPPGRAEMGGH